MLPYKRELRVSTSIKISKSFMPGSAKRDKPYLQGIRGWIWAGAQKHSHHIQATTDERFTRHAAPLSSHPSTSVSVSVPERLPLIALRHVCSNACTCRARLLGIQHVAAALSLPCYARARRHQNKTRTSLLQGLTSSLALSGLLGPPLQSFYILSFQPPASHCDKALLRLLPL
jgi:hypothetical protein